MNDTASAASDGVATNKDSASVSSHHTQTRFSFYNAQDFVQPPPTATLSPQPQQQQPQHDTNRDSVEILKSLQEHEQQRLEILGGSNSHPAAVEAESRRDGTTPTHYTHHAHNSTTSTHNHHHHSTASSEVSNPYEDAIKEALDLLRKHRTPRAAGDTTTTAAFSSLNGMLLHPPSSPQSSSKAAAASSSSSWTRMNPRSRTPPEADRILQLRDEPPQEDTAKATVLLAAESAMDPSSSEEALATATTPSAVALGEAYQAEIEARRKQRQERMARYASRLAELKQEDKYSTPLEAPAAPGSSSHSDVVVGPQPWQLHHASQPEAALASLGHPTTTTTLDDDHAEGGGALTSRSVPSSTTFRTKEPEPDDDDRLPTLLSTSAAPSQVSSMNPSTTLSSHNTTTNTTEQEVHRGVERVLLAILERAHSQGRGSRGGGEQPPSLHALAEPTRTPHDDDSQSPPPTTAPHWPTTHPPTTTTTTTTTSRGEEKKTASPEETRPQAVVEVLDNTTNGENALVRAMTDLLGAPSTSTLGSSSPNHNARLLQPPTEAAVPAVSTTSSTTRPKTNLTIDTSLVGAAQPPPRDETPPEDDLDKMVRLQEERVVRSKKDDVIDRRVRSVLSPDPDKQRNEDQEDQDDDDDDDYEDKESGSADIRGSDVPDDVVEEEEDEDADIDDDDDEDDDAFCDIENDDENQNNHSELDGVLGPLSKNAGGTTGVVLEGDMEQQRDSYTSPSLLDSLSAAVSMVTGALNDETGDKYSSHEVDEETDELMETLCAHLLDSNMVQSLKLVDKRPDWDESNPDEAGYRIIRLTTLQLAAVEYAFERMIATAKKRAHDDDENDEAFERDLKEAEDLLDKQELASKEAAKKSRLEDEIATRARIYPKEQPLACFPGVKSTGRGEMGDLEYFHLPIIYKSHVTGFEPTKDLVLEAGNVVAGQYLVEGELGSAAFSTAYRCVDLSSDGDGPDGHDEVCLKVIKNTKDFFDQSLDEIKILELLRQTGMCQEMNIVEMKTFFYHREHLIIVTELLRQNLFEFGKFIIDSNEEPYFTIPRLCYLTRQILIALDFVHKLGLVHSDVKPENILLSSYSRAQVKVIDFGSSCFLTDRQSSYIQSRSYRAPEVILGLPYDGRIDVWSLGCVVAEMYTGEVTFQNDSIVSMLSRIEAICGTFPSHMIAQGRQSGRFFTKCGLLFEKLASDEHEHEDSQSETSDDDDDTSCDRRKKYVDLFQPKVTCLSSRLGFSSSLMRRYNSNAKLSKDEKQQAVFTDFIQKLLTIDPDKRPSASEALEHPWMKYAESLTEEDIKYPSN